MKNITLSVDDETYRQARLLAAKREQSVSALVRDLINESAANPTLAIGEPRASYRIAPTNEATALPSVNKRASTKKQPAPEKPVKEMSFLEFMRASPWYGTNLEIKRDKRPYVPKNLFDEGNE